MAFDIEMIQSVYSRLEDRITQARNLVGKPLPLLKRYCIPTCGEYSIFSEAVSDFPTSFRAWEMRSSNRA